jgi:hypothetical protein
LPAIQWYSPEPVKVFDSFSPIAAVQFGAAFAGRPDQHDGKARVERHGHEGRLAVARDTFDADMFGVHRFVGFKIVESARGAPGPGAQRAPVVRLAGLALVDQPDDPFGQAGAIVRLNASRVDVSVTPAIGDQLMCRGRISAD